MIRDLSARPHLIERKAGLIVATPLKPVPFDVKGGGVMWAFRRSVHEDRAA